MRTVKWLAVIVLAMIFSGYAVLQAHHPSAVVMNGFFGNFGGLNSFVGGTFFEYQRIDQPASSDQSDKGSKRAEANLEPRYGYDLLSRGRHRLLSGEIIALTGVGILFAALGALGFFGVFYYPDWKRKTACALLVFLGGAGTAIFYGWAISGRWDGILCRCFA